MKHITTTDASIPRSAALELLRSWFLRQPSAWNALNRGLLMNNSESASEELEIDITRSVTDYHTMPDLITTWLMAAFPAPARFAD